MSGKAITPPYCRAEKAFRTLNSHLFTSPLVREHHSPTISKVRIRRSKRPRERFLHGRSLQRSLQSGKAPFFFNTPQTDDAIAFGESDTDLRSSADVWREWGREGGRELEEERHRERNDDANKKPAQGEYIHGAEVSYKLPTSAVRSHPGKLLFVEVANVLAEP